MADDPRRDLTGSEKALVRAAFGDRVKLDGVRICHGSGGNPVAAVALRGNDAITLIRTIFFRGAAVADYSAAGDRHLFMHEMTHIWQYQTLGVARFYALYARDFAAGGFRKKAMYHYRKGDPFGAAKLEAQADMVSDYGRGAAGRDKAGASLAGTGLYGL